MSKPSTLPWVERLTCLPVSIVVKIPVFEKLDVNKKSGFLENLFGGGKKKDEIVEPVECKSGGTEPERIN